MQSAEEVVAFMRRHGLVLATAESCTSGLIASQLADISGAGACLDRAFVTYTVQAKIDLLGVNRRTIDQFNLTSEAVAKEMARGALAASHANVAISNTGVVDDSDPSVPAGTQCLAWAFNIRGTVTVYSERCRFLGDRRAMREACARYALAQLPAYYRRLSNP